MKTSKVNNGYRECMEGKGYPLCKIRVALVAWNCKREGERKLFPKKKLLGEKERLKKASRKIEKEESFDIRRNHEARAEFREKKKGRGGDLIGLSRRLLSGTRIQRGGLGSFEFGETVEKVGNTERSQSSKRERNHLGTLKKGY